MKYFVNLDGWTRNSNTAYKEFSKIDDARKYAISLIKKGIGKREDHYEISILTPYLGRNVGGDVRYFPVYKEYTYWDEGLQKISLLNKDGTIVRKRRGII